MHANVHLNICKYRWELNSRQHAHDHISNTYICVCTNAHIWSLLYGSFNLMMMNLILFLNFSWVTALSQHLFTKAKPYYPQYLKPNDVCTFPSSVQMCSHKCGQKGARRIVWTSINRNTSSLCIPSVASSRYLSFEAYTKFQNYHFPHRL